MKSKRIILSDNFDTSISIRSAVKSLFNFDITDLNEVVLDFSGISIISSSAAHQIIIEKRRFEKEKKELTFENINDNIRRMLDLSENSRRNLFTHQTFEHKKFNNEEELTSFLLG